MLRNVLILICVINSLSLLAMAETDTIAPPPPAPVFINGPDTVCVYDSSAYSANLPISCSASWYIDDVLQTDDTLYEIEVVWDTAGDHMILLKADCDSANPILDSMSVFVKDVAQQPSPIVGNNDACAFDAEIYSTMINDDEVCNWYINDSVLPDTVGEISIDWNSVGAQILMVNAENQCGPGDSVSLGVSVMSSPEVFLGNDTTIFYGDTLVLDAQNPGSDYLWNIGDTNQIIKVFNSGIFYVDVSNYCGYESDTIIVDVVVGKAEIKEKSLKYYTEREFMRFEIPQEEVLKVQVFNLRGELIYESFHENQIRLSARGLLMLRLQTNDNKYVIKFVM